MAEQKNPFRSKRLLYRAVEPEQDEAFFLSIMQDSIGYMNANATLPKPQNKKTTQKFMKYVEEEALAGVVMCLPPSPDFTSSQTEPIPIGSIHLSAVKPSMAHHRFTDIGIDVLPQYQGQGYGSEAIEWILEFAFLTAGLHRVGIRCFSYNEGARRLYARLGFKEESVVREALFHKGHWWDDIGFGMLEREWKEMRKEKGSE